VMNHKTRKVRTGVAFGLITGLFLSVAAMAMPTGKGGDVCRTGFTSDPEYRRHCLSTGTKEDAAVAWYVGYSDAQRLADCRWAAKHGGMVRMVRETRGDVLTDNFRNGQQMIRWTARMGVVDCRAHNVGK
jgi:hypothetical protein